jgi:hypothetical protein
MGLSVTLRNVRDDQGTRHLEARFTDEGDFVFAGQDLGRGVEQAFGDGLREYEWIWTIRKSDVPALERALEATNATLLARVAERFADPRCAEIEPFLRSRAIAFERWSRLGD